MFKSFKIWIIQYIIFPLYHLYIFRNLKRKLRLKSKAIAWDFTTLNAYLAWFSITNSWERSKQFLNKYVLGKNFFFKKLYFLEGKFKSSNFAINLLLLLFRYFWLNFHLFGILFAEGVFHAYLQSRGYFLAFLELFFYSYIIYISYLLKLFSILFYFSFYFLIFFFFKFPFILFYFLLHNFYLNLRNYYIDLHIKKLEKQQIRKEKKLKSFFKKFKSKFNRLRFTYWGSKNDNTVILDNKYTTVTLDNKFLNVDHLDINIFDLNSIKVTIQKKTIFKYKKQFSKMLHKFIGASFINLKDSIESESEIFVSSEVDLEDTNISDSDVEIYEDFESFGLTLWSLKVFEFRGFEEKKELINSLERGDKFASFELRRLRLINENSSYFKFFFSYMFGFLLNRLTYFLIILPFEKAVSIFDILVFIIRLPFDYYKHVLNPALLPLILTNILFFFFRFMWGAIWTVPLPYGYIWTVRYLRRIGWLKLHADCWTWWVTYWRFLILLRYTFRVPSYYYRQPKSYSNFIHLPYAERQVLFRFYHRYIPYYGVSLCFIWFQTCMFWFPPTWSHSEIFIGPLKIF